MGKEIKGKEGFDEQWEMFSGEEVFFNYSLVTNTKQLSKNRMNYLERLVESGKVKPPINLGEDKYYILDSGIIKVDKENENIYVSSEVDKKITTELIGMPLKKEESYLK